MWGSQWTMRGYSLFSRAPKLELCNQVQFNVKTRILNSFKYCYQTLIILFNIIDSLTHKVSSIAICGTMGLHSFLWVSTTQRIPLSVLARIPHKWLSWKITFKTGRRREKARFQNRRKELATVGERRLLSEELGLVDPEARLANTRG